MPTVTITVDTKGIEQIPGLFEKAAYQATGQLLEFARIKAREFAPELTGRLKGSNGGLGGISWRIEIIGNVINGILAAVAHDPVTGIDYAYFVHEGTGEEGPRKKLIYPKKGKFLVFLKKEYALLPRPTTPQQWKEYREKGMVVYARFSKGMKPNPFLKKALEEAAKIAISLFQEAINRINGGVS